MSSRRGGGLPRLAGLALLLGACVAQPPPRSLPEALAARGVSPQSFAPLQLDDEMRRWAHGAVPSSAGVDERLDRLLIALIRRPAAPLRYRPGRTTGLREVWESGAANCLSFSHLFIAMARELGLDAYYLRVRELGSVDRDGDLLVVSDHVTAATGSGASRRILDFSDRPIRRYVDLEPLDDLRALALHYSNQGAEAIRAGDAERALELLIVATELDPGLADGWINLGVARRRSGDLAGAESSYRRALAADAESASAIHNLAALLESLGRGAEARALLDAVSRASLRNPWTALALGGIALRGGRLEEAERFFRRAARQMPDSAEPWLALAEWALAAGELSAARRHAERALRLEPGLPAAQAVLARLAGPR